MSTLTKEIMFTIVYRQPTSTLSIASPNIILLAHLTQYVENGFSINFLALDITVAPRQRVIQQGRNATDGLPLALTTRTHLVCVAHLTLMTVG